jgi:crotonobetainyl-CoA:carnitine CoA-transferase CaiB-like acyl-CoA transferase
MGNAHPSVAPYELLDTADGALVVAIGTDRQFAALCEVIGAPELAADERFATNAGRVSARAELRPELLRRLAARPAPEWAKLLTARAVPAGMVNDIGRAFELAERLGLEPTVDIPREGGGSARLTRNPIRLSETPATYRAAPPDLPS